MTRPSAILATNLLLVLLAQISSAQQSRVALTAVLRCPSDANLQLLTAVAEPWDLSMCAAGCSSSDGCLVIHIPAGSSRCYQGSDVDFAAAWDRVSSSQQDGCVSYLKYLITEIAEPTQTSFPPSMLISTSSNSPKAAASTTNSNTAETGSTTILATSGSTTTTQASVSVPGLTSGLTSKLVLLFDFRQSYTNLVNPKKFNATPKGSVTRDSQGAHFPGGSADFIDVDTDGNTLASTYLDYSNNFTFYVRLVRQTWYKQSYHYFHDCFGSWRSEFADENGQLRISHSYSNQTNLLDKTETIQSIATNLVSTSATPSDVSAAAVFTGIRFSTFYFNRIATAGGTDLNYAFQGFPQCLRLGYHPVSGSALNGLFICYGIARVALGADEITELSQFCG